MAMTAQVAWLACLALLQATAGLASLARSSLGTPEILVLDNVLNSLEDPLSERNGTSRHSLTGTPGLVGKAVDGVGVILDTLEAAQWEESPRGMPRSPPHAPGKRAKRQSVPYETYIPEGYYQVQPQARPQPYPEPRPQQPYPQTRPQPYPEPRPQQPYPQTRPQPYPEPRPQPYPQTRPQPFPPGYQPRIYQRPTCPLPQPISNENKWEYLKRIVVVQNQCRINNPCKTCRGKESREPCVFDFDTLMTRLALLEDKLKDFAKLEARLKIHVSLLMSIQHNPNFPGVPGAKGHAGEKGEGRRLSFAGSSGNCLIRRSVSFLPAAAPPGPPGDKGAPGQTGPKVCGCDGELGSPGERGDDVKGPRGRRGRKGEKGPPGYNARP
ncbi:collagen alpha-1(V) chain-like [Penaeus japonicus]|uniref:collagen alpha-1(V) chain-like n=1 Tax=Penaeus japonicus TaxID=27405 RepID=UPI001C713564|nr:collagen alpha-1(V) chain-like [Penaeus japonicus]